MNSGNLNSIKRIVVVFCVILFFLNLSATFQPAQCENLKEKLFWQRKFLDYLRKIEKHFDETNGNYAIQHYIESYAIRALLVAFDNYTNDRRDLNYAIQWTERMISLQGKTLHPGAYSMGYDETGYEKPLGWYPADCSCIGLAVLAVASNPQIFGAQRDRYIQSVKLFADYVIEHWRNPNGSIQTGWRNFELNPIQEFWISTSLFSSLCWHLFDVTGIEKYKNVAMEACDWLLNFDYYKSEVTPGTKFEDGIPTFVVYLGEGLIIHAEHLRKNEEYFTKIKKKMRQLVNLVLENQRKDGGLDCRVKWWRQKLPAMYFTLDWYYRHVEKDTKILSAANKILEYSFSEAAELELQVGIHTQATTFAFLALACKCVPDYVFPKPKK
jgi:hypothetical protein